MKKKIIYMFVFIMFLILLFSTTVSAKTISANDIENRTYIIGEHMYTRETNGDYAGRLTTQYIMLGSSTIDSNDLGDFIIYYKNPLGEWKDALTNQTVTAPETFDIKYTNGQQTDKVLYGDVDCDGKVTEDDATYLLYHTMYPSEYELTEEGKINADVNADVKINSNDASIIQKHVKNEKGYETLPYTGSSIQYGDVNCDGAINTKDVSAIRRFLAGYEITEEINLANADVNIDGKITAADYELLRKYIAGWWQEKNLPEEPLGKSYSIEYVIENGASEIDFGLEGQTLNKPTEPKKEGYTFDGWYKDEEYKTKFEFSNVKLTENIKLYGRFIKIQYGDVDCNGEIDVGDVVYIKRYVDEQISSGMDLRNADVNGDGAITEADHILLSKYLANYYPEANLPEEPLGDTCRIEYVFDEGNDFPTYAIDYELNGHTISSSRKPKDPEMDGYIFEGWYDLMDDKKFEFGVTLTPKMAKDLVLYAKFVKIGDVDNDGDITLGDVVDISRHLEGYEMLAEPNISYGDVNKDGELDDVDLQILSKFIVDPEGYGITKLPYDSGEKYKISYNLNGGMQDDRNITTYAQISLPFTLEAPTKEGYVFTGWTGSNGTTPQIEVTIEEGTTGNLEYTANWKSST